MEPIDRSKLIPVEDFFDLQNKKRTYLKFNESSKVYYTLSIVDGIFKDYFSSFFSKNFFKTFRFATEADFGKVIKGRSEIPEKPMLFIDNTSHEISDKTLFYNNWMKKFNQDDPEMLAQSELYGANILFADDKCELYYRPSRYNKKYNVLMVYKTYEEMFDKFNDLCNNMRNSSMYSIDRIVSVRIASKFVLNIAALNNMDYRSDEFMEYLNSKSDHTFIRKLVSNKYLFFVNFPTTIHVEIPDLPSPDSFNRSGMVEGDSKLAHIIVFELELPTNWHFLVVEDNSESLITGIEEPPNSVAFIAPWDSRGDIPDEDGFSMFTRNEVMASGDDNHINIAQLLSESEYSKILDNLIGDSEFDKYFRVKVFDKHNNPVTSIDMDKTGEIYIINPDPSESYDLVLMINLEAVNNRFINLNKFKVGSYDTGNMTTGQIKYK